MSSRGKAIRPTYGTDIKDFGTGFRKWKKVLASMTMLRRVIGEAPKGDHQTFDGAEKYSLVGISEGPSQRSKDDRTI